MNNDLHHSHDKLFRETWSDLSNAKSFLQSYLPAKVLRLVRLDSLEICKDSFIEADLRQLYRSGPEGLLFGYALPGGFRRPARLYLFSV